MTDTAPLEIETWDDGRLLVNPGFAPLLRANGLTTFEVLFHLGPGEIVRAIDNRTTSRIVLPGENGPVAVYLKRHRRPAVRQFIRPLLHASRPILGAHHEWEAILRFHKAGLPTVTPIAFGQSRGKSLVMTQDLCAEETLLDWVNRTSGDESSSAAEVASATRRLTVRVAEIARRMHESGMHHQDFYLNHLLHCGPIENMDIRVIDLGRVQKADKLARRWIIKDLAQLDFSARRLGCYDRLRFLRLYLGRPFRPEDRHLVRRIVAKSRRIAAHTERHGL